MLTFLFGTLFFVHLSFHVYAKVSGNNVFDCLQGSSHLVRCITVTQQCFMVLDTSVKV